MLDWIELGRIVLDWVGVGGVLWRRNRGEGGRGTGDANMISMI